MEHSQFKTIDINGIGAVYLGSITSNKVILFIGRSNSQKYSAPLENLLSNLESNGFLLLWPENRYQSINNLLVKRSTKAQSWINQLFGSKDLLFKRNLLRLIKGFILIGRPSQWGYFFEWLRGNHQSLYLRDAIQLFGENKAVYILSHSAGGIIASNLASEANLHKIICFGYPFQHPNHEKEVYRTAALKDFQKPFLIIQGNNDEYGGFEILKEYELSPKIEIEFVESNHEYDNLSAEDWIRVTQRIAKFLDN